MRDCQFINTSSRGSYIPHSYMEHIFITLSPLIVLWVHYYVIKNYLLIRLHERTDQGSLIEERMKDIYLRVEGGL